MLCYGLPDNDGSKDFWNLKYPLNFYDFFKRFDESPVKSSNL